MQAQSFDQFHWEPQPLAQKLVSELVIDFLSRCPAGAELARRMKQDTGTRFADWVDFIEEPASATLRERLARAGFTREPLPGAPECYVHKGAIFPGIVLRATGRVASGAGQAAANGSLAGAERTDDEPTRIGLKVDSVADFLATWKLDVPVEGGALTPFRRARCFYQEFGLGFLCRAL